MQAQDFQQYLRRTVLVPLVLLAALGGILLWQLSYVVGTLRGVDQSERVIADAHLLLQLTVDQETGLRGFLANGDEGFLEPFNQADKNEAAILAELHRLLADDPELQGSLRRIEDATQRWKSYANDLIALRRSGRSVNADRSIAVEGKRRMDAVRAGWGKFVITAERIRGSRIEKSQSVTRRALILLGALTAAVAIVVVGLTRHRMMAISETYTRHLTAERLQSEEARSNREWLLTTLRSIGEGVIATDPQGRIEFLNAAGEELTGWKQSEARGRPVTEVLKTFDEGTGLPIRDPAEFIRSRQSHGAQVVVSVLERRNGERRVIDESAAPMLDAKGNLRGIVIVARDMTERRRAENALRSSERLALVGRLSATIAHEIQNPLDAVTNLLYLIEHSEGVPESAQGYSQLAQEEVGRITQITRQLLSFNRESREPVPVNLTEIVDSVIGLFGPKLTASGIRVTKKYDTDEKVLGLPGELRQVFSNLLGNAIEAIGKGGEIQLRVSAGLDWRDFSRPGVRVTIADNGCGIPKQAQTNLFTPFFTTKGEEGTGLGLWVSRGIVEKHEGTMRFRTSTDGHWHGTVFNVFLPMEPSARASAGNAA